MKITDSVHLLTQEFSLPVKPGFVVPRKVNFYIIEAQKLYLIDCGTKQSYNLIKQYIQSIGRNLSEIEAVFLTHSHPDHMGCLQLLQAETQCQVYIHTNEQKWVENTARQYNERPVPGFEAMVAGPAKASHVMCNDETFALEEGIVIDAIHTPGHSQGSVSYYLKNKHLLFSGDAVLVPGELPVYNNVNAYISSIEKIGDLPMTTTILSAFDNPKSGEDFADVLSGSLAYIQHIDGIVKKNAVTLHPSHPMDFCIQVVKDLGMPEQIANPLILQSFLAHLKP